MRAEYIDQPQRQDVNIPLPVDSKWVNSPITLRATLCLGLNFDRAKVRYLAFVVVRYKDEIDVAGGFALLVFESHLSE